MVLAQTIILVLLLLEFSLKVGVLTLFLLEASLCCFLLLCQLLRSVFMSSLLSFLIGHKLLLLLLQARVLYSKLNVSCFHALVSAF